MLIEDLPFELKVRGVFEELYASDSQFESEFLEYKYPNSLTGMDSENLTLHARWVWSYNFGPYETALSQ